jgi:hypothetical protein
VSPRSVIVLAAVTAVALIGAIVAMIAEPRATPRSSEDRLVLAGLAERMSEVTQIAIVGAGDDLTMTRDSSGSWSMPTKDGFTAKADRVREFLVGLGDRRYREAKTGRAERHARLNVEDPGAEGAQSSLVTLRDASGQELGSVIVGRPRSYAFGANQLSTYIRLPGDPQTWLATGRVDAGASFRDWVDRNIIDLDMDVIRSMSVRQPDGTELTVLRREGEPGFVVAGDPAIPSGQRLDQSEVNFLSTGLAYLDLDDVAAAQGFAFPLPVHTAEVTLSDGRRIIAETADHDGEVWVRLRAFPAPDGDSGWVESFNARVGPWADRVPDVKIKKLRGTLGDLLEPIPQEDPEPTQ